MIIPRFTTEINLKSFIKVWSGLKKFRCINKRNTLYFNSCSEAVTFFLKELNLPDTAIVGVPLYSCSSVFNSIKSAKLNIKYLDMAVTPEGYKYDPEDFKDINVLIFIHYFGYYYPDLQKIKQQYPDLIIIEDCTHIREDFYSPDNNTESACFSYNFHKPISCGIGGMIRINSDSLYGKLQESHSLLPSFGVSQSIKRLLGIVIKNYGYNQYVYTLLYQYLKTQRKAGSRLAGTENIISPTKINNLAKYLIGNQYCEKKAEIPAYYKELANSTKINANIEHLIYFPVFFSSKEAQVIAAASLRRKGIDAYILWENCFINAKVYGKLEGEYANTKKMLETILFIPRRVFSEKRIFSQVKEILQGGLL